MYQFLIIALFNFDTKEKSLIKHCVCSNFFVSVLRFLSVCTIKHSEDCTVRLCPPLRRKFMVCSIIQLALSILMEHLGTGQHQKARNFSAFHWSPHGRMVSIGQHFVTTRVVHLPKRTETSLITESDKKGPNHRIGPCYAGRTRLQ